MFATSSTADQLMATITGDIPLTLARLQYEMKIGAYAVVGLERIANPDGAPLVCVLVVVCFLRVSLNHHVLGLPHPRYSMANHRECCMAAHIRTIMRGYSMPMTISSPLRPYEIPRPISCHAFCLATFQDVMMEIG